MSEARQPTPLTVLYIGGSGRTGSTLLDRILGQLDGFFSAGELCNLWERGAVAHRRCGCGEPFPQCPTWSAVLRRTLAVDGSSPDPEWLADMARRRLRSRRLPGLPWLRQQVADDYSRTLVRLYDAIQAETACRVIVDSSKSPLYAELLASLPRVNLFVVHLVRDPRATAYSFRRKRELPDFGDSRLMLQQHPITTARRWVKGQAFSELLGRRGSVPYLRLRYEDFIRDPRAAVGRILSLLGETAELGFVDSRTVRLQATHLVSGNPNRFAVGDIMLRLDDEWMTSMRGRDVLAVTALTWPLLLRHGYPLWPRSRKALGRNGGAGVSHRDAGFEAGQTSMTTRVDEDRPQP
jgi:Sulfotransferase family